MRPSGVCWCGPPPPMVGLSAPSSPAPSATLRRTVPSTVLIVDDHPSFRASARRLLEAEGFHVVGEAPDGRTAIANVLELAPDLVLLDVALPDLDGFEVARRLTAGRDLAVVLTSSRDWASIGTLVADSGARGFVAKDDLSGAALTALVG
jgi:DNA-binding NarL/FixJ family response regulator